MPPGESPANSWVTSQRPIPRLFVRPLREFLDTETAGGIVLLAATAVALGWANSPWSAAYDTLWSIELAIHLGPFSLVEDLRHWVNDGLMAVFFFVVALEIKREMGAGELRYARSAALPCVGALGGMIVPALLYWILNLGGKGAAGWGIPMATDIAFALGVLAIFGPRVPAALKVFLLTLAIVDDIGAILVIAMFYSGGIQIPWLLVACVFLLAVVALRSIEVWWVPVYIVLGVGVWIATYQSGIHATIAGVALGLLTPSQAQVPPTLDETPPLKKEPDPQTAQSISALARASVSVVERLEHVLHPWTSYFIVPIFALANAGITLGGGVVAAAVKSPITTGIVIGLVVGKLSGVFGVSLARTPFRFRHASRGGQVASYCGSRGGGRHRVHGVDLHSIACVLRSTACCGSEDWSARRLGVGDAPGSGDSANRRWFSAPIDTRATAWPSRRTARRRWLNGDPSSQFGLISHSVCRSGGWPFVAIASGWESTRP